VRVARVLLACELGNGKSHVRRLATLALAFQDQGHDTVLVIPDLPRAETVRGDRPLRLLQVPLWRSPVAGLPPVHTYTDLLLRHGFVQATGLRGLARAWRDLVDLLQPDLLVLDHAPVALFATRGLGVPRLRFGDGFGCPPLARPMPAMTWWDPTPEPFDAIGERNALHVANQVAADLGLPRAASVADLLTAEGEALCIAPELDAYAHRAGGAYVGPLVLPDEGAATPWPGGEAACCLVALSARHPQLPALVQALQASGQRAVLQLADCSPEQAQALTGDGIVVARTPVPVAQVRRHCSHAVVDGHNNRTHALLLAGKPLLLLPTVLAQRMTARRVEDLGAGLVAGSVAGSVPGPGADPVEPLEPLLRRLVDDPSLAAAALAFGARHADHDDGRSLAATQALGTALMNRTGPRLMPE
jgi:hypothetical protein